MSTARLRALDRAAIRGGAGGRWTSSVGAAEVPAVAGVDLELLAGADEQRHLDLRAGLQRGGLGAAGGAVALQARVGVLDDELHGHGQLDVERGAVVDGHDDLGVLEQVVRAVADGLGRHVDLVVGVAVHEDEVGAVLVQVGHRPLVDVGRLDLGAGVERLVDDLPREHVLQRGPHERATLAGLDVLAVGHRPELTVQVEDDAVLQVVGGRHQRTRSALLVRVNSSGASSVTIKVSSMRTPPWPGRYTPGSTVTAMPLARLPAPRGPMPGASWISRPTPWPSPWGKCSPCPAATITSREAASTATTSAPTARAARPAACEAATSS